MKLQGQWWTQSQNCLHALKNLTGFHCNSAHSFWDRTTGCSFIQNVIVAVKLSNLLIILWTPFVRSRSVARCSDGLCQVRIDSFPCTWQFLLSMAFPVDILGWLGHIQLGSCQISVESISLAKLIFFRRITSWLVDFRMLLFCDVLKNRK